MAHRRGMMLVGGVVTLAVLQIAYEDLLVFAGATGGDVPISSPFLLVGIPLVSFYLLAGLLYGWAILGSEPLR